jgi:peptidyl-tRNA hydrolase, PTH1 family
MACLANLGLTCFNIFMNLVVGLGNPGDKYANTRHNAGFMFVDWWAREEMIEFSRSSTGILEQAWLWERSVAIIKPLTFVNQSGVGIKEVLKKFPELHPDQIIVIHDDVDLSLGEYRLQKNRGSAGHNGVKSINDALATQDYTRIRLGIGSTPEHFSTESYVLGAFAPDEIDKLESAFPHVRDELLSFLKN